MADSGTRAARKFEQPDDAITCYADLTQIVATEHEVIVQFYEPVPGLPEPASGGPESVRMILRATIIVNKPHAVKLGAQILEAARAGMKPDPASKPSV